MSLTIVICSHDTLLALHRTHRLQCPVSLLATMHACSVQRTSLDRCRNKFSVNFYSFCPDSSLALQYNAQLVVPPHTPHA